MKWIESGGGPLLCLPVGLSHDWEGCDHPSAGRVVVSNFKWNDDGISTDYDRACDISDEDELRLLDVGTGQGLVVGQYPQPAAWWNEHSWNDGILVCRDIFYDDDVIIQHLTNLTKDPMSEETLLFTFHTSPLLLFDSAAKLTELDDSEILKFNLSSGTYKINTRTLFMSECSRLTFHVFSKVE